MTVTIENINKPRLDLNPRKMIPHWALRTIGGFAYLWGVAAESFQTLA